MVVEFAGGSLNGMTKTVDRFFDILNNNGEMYQARAIRYEKLNWTYVWYETTGLHFLHSEQVNG